MCSSSISVQCLDRYMPISVPLGCQYNTQAVNITTVASSLTLVGILHIVTLYAFLSHCHWICSCHNL